eukprot:g15630.t1
MLCYAILAFLRPLLLTDLINFSLSISRWLGAAVGSLRAYVSRGAGGATLADAGPGQLPAAVVACGAPVQTGCGPPTRHRLPGARLLLR